MQITDVFVGGARESLKDRVSPSLPLSPIIAQFGKYLKVIVVLETEKNDSTSTMTPTRDAFSVMLSAASKKGVPSPLPGRNQKEHLYNSVLQFCEKQNFVWKGDEINTIGVKFVRCMCDILWYVDGPAPSGVCE